MIMEEQDGKFVGRFESQAKKYQFSLGLESLPNPVPAVNARTLGLFFLVQGEHAVFKSMFLKKSAKFIFLNKETGKYNLIDLSRGAIDPSGEMAEAPTAEQLKTSFFVQEI